MSGSSTTVEACKPPLAGHGAKREDAGAWPELPQGSPKRSIVERSLVDCFGKQRRTHSRAEPLRIADAAQILVGRKQYWRSAMSSHNCVRLVEFGRNIAKHIWYHNAMNDARNSVRRSWAGFIQVIVKAGLGDACAASAQSGVRYCPPDFVRAESIDQIAAQENNRPRRRRRCCSRRWRACG